MKKNKVDSSEIKSDEPIILSYNNIFKTYTMLYDHTEAL